MGVGLLQSNFWNFNFRGGRPCHPSGGRCQVYYNIVNLKPKLYFIHIRILNGHILAHLEYYMSNQKLFHQNIVLNIAKSRCKSAQTRMKCWPISLQFSLKITCHIPDRKTLVGHRWLWVAKYSRWATTEPLLAH